MKQRSTSRKRLGLIGVLGLLLTTSVAIQAKAAERIFARYSVLERSISVNSLEVYAKEGRYTDDLQTYTRFFKQEQLEQLRGGLLTPVELDSLTIAQFLYTPIGERLLKRVSEVVKPRSGVNGFYALRSALILAAGEDDGLTALNVLKKYPTSGIQVDLGAGLELFQEAQTLIKQTSTVVEAIEKSTPPPLEPPLPIPDAQLSKPGPWTWTTTSFEFRDEGQKRLDYSGQAQTFPVDLYLPKESTNDLFPIVVISHGLNSDQQSFQYLAEHLVSHGFAVVVPEHPGSSRDQLMALLNGQANDVINRTEFLDRPLDISYALDELERIASSVPSMKNKLDFKNVGIIGQSFGGYTALSTAGAKIDFDNLKSDCDVNLDNTYNLSLLLQCLALRLPARDYDLSDPRIKGAIALNPIGSSMFGKNGISQMTVPTMIIGGSADTVAPLVPEQVVPFLRQTNPDRYFALVNGGTHFSFIAQDESEDSSIPQLQEFLGRRPDIAQNYVKSLSLAFLGRHVVGKESYAPYLSPTYGSAVSREPLPLSLLTELPPLDSTLSMGQ